MAKLVQMTGFEKTMDRLYKNINDFAKEGTVIEGIVGYSAPYGIYVHENMEIDHPVHLDGTGSTRDCGGQAKFLEIPARRWLPRVKDTMRKLKQQKKGLKYSVRYVLEKIFNESQKLVPVLTGRLKRSGFVRVKVRSRTTGRFVK